MNATAESLRCWKEGGSLTRTVCDRRKRIAFELFSHFCSHPTISELSICPHSRHVPCIY